MLSRPQKRILRRACVNGNYCLKTTDQCKKVSLLSGFVPNAVKISPIKHENGVLLCELENILSSEQCCQIIRNANNCEFQDMSDKYREGEQRNSSRLLVLDETLAQNIWGNIEPVLTKKMKDLDVHLQPLGFDVRRGEWQLHGINEAMRLSKYCGKANEFFGVHKDAQYCPSGDERSLFTLLVYLNENFNGGETCFYFPKAIKNTKAMTTEEEIAAHGGLSDGFHQVKYTPKLGHAVLFSQNLLHESLPVVTGFKYILKTDILLKRHTKLFGFAVQAAEQQDYMKCLNYFREAQQLEMKLKYSASSDLYERALSIRYAYPQCLTHSETSDNNDIENNSEFLLLPLHIWENIFRYLPSKDGRNLVYAFPELNLAKRCWERHEYVNAGCLSNEKYMPKMRYHKGVVSCFEFPDADFFKENEFACCRVAAMYSFFLLGQKPDDDVYTVRYNPETRDVCAVALETLLSDVFYNRQCYGAFYNVRQRHPDKKNPKQDFELSVDRNHILLQHGVEFTGVELPSLFRSDCKSYGNAPSGEDSESDDSEDDSNSNGTPVDDDFGTVDGNNSGDDTTDMVTNNSKTREEEGEESTMKKDGTNDSNYDGDDTTEMVTNDSNTKGKKKKKKSPKSDIFEDGNVWFNGEVNCYININWLVRMHIEICDRENAQPINNDDLPDDMYEEFKLDDNDDRCSTSIYYEQLQAMDEAKSSVSCTLVSRLMKPIRVEENVVCICYFMPSDDACDLLGRSCTTDFYNHLIFDFQKSHLVVTHDDVGMVDCDSETELLHRAYFGGIAAEQVMLGCSGDSKSYNVNISPLLTNGTSFNHASCQCGNAPFEIDNYYGLKSYPCLDHVHLVARVLDDKMMVWAVYGGIVAL